MRLNTVILQIAVLLAGAGAFSKEHDLLPILEKKQSVISGVLNPGSVSYNGQEIYNGKENFSALLLNKVPVEINSVSGLQTFYFTTDKASFDLEWLAMDGTSRPLLSVQHPAITEFKTDADQLYFKFNENVASAKIDSKEINLQESNLQIDRFKDWISEAHTLELVSKKNTSQIYNLDFRNLKKELLTTTSLAFSFGDSAFSANKNPTAFGLSLRRLDEGNVSMEVAVYVAKVTYDMGWTNSVNTVSQSVGQLKGRYGYNPFDSNYGGFSLRRFTAGIQSEMIYYKRESTFPTSFDGQNTDKAELWYFQGGPFFRWEPLQYKEWGVFLNLDFRIFRTETNVSSNGDENTFGVLYYF